MGVMRSGETLEWKCHVDLDIVPHHHADPHAPASAPFSEDGSHLVTETTKVSLQSCKVHHSV